MTSRALIIASTLLATSAGAQDFGQNRLCQGMGPPPSTEWGPPGPPGGRGPQGPPPVVEPPFLLDRLDLDPRTREQMERIRAEAAEPTESIQARVAEELDRLQELMEEEPFDRDAILAQAAIVEDLRKESHLLRLDAVLRVRALLTPEQREELRKMHRELAPRGPRPGGPPRRGPGPHGGPPPRGT